MRKCVELGVEESRQRLPCSRGTGSMKEELREIMIGKQSGLRCQSPSMESKDFWPPFVSQGPIYFLTKDFLSVKK